MSTYVATVLWQRNEQIFTDNQYSRGHLWCFDGGQEIPASSSPHIVPLPYSVAENVDPEEAFVASLSSCHMLFFLSIAAKRQFVVESYKDEALGYMGHDSEGKQYIQTVTLRPLIEFSGERQPTHDALQQMHHQSHELCFIANSVKTDVVIDILSP